MNREEIRAAFMNRPLQTLDLNATLPGLEQLEGQLSLQELTAETAVQSETLGQTNTETPDKALQLGATIIAALITRDTKERVFADADVQFVANFGLSVITPIATQIAELSGTTVDALANAKKN